VKSVQELIPPAILNKSVVKKFNYSGSCVAINNGNGQFSVQKLPPMVQLSSVNTVHSMDVNNDDIPDLVVGGNQFNFLPQLERLDASLGDILLNDGKGNMKWVEAGKTGFELRGQVRDMAEIRGKNRKFFLILQNDELPQLFTLNEKIKNTNRK
jgi:hypothetical protein